MNEKKKIGIIGGMGSVAAAYFFDRLIELTPAETDQQYIETFVHNNSAIPDRTDGILYGKTSPLNELKRSVKILNECGADYLLMACITSHFFAEKLQTDSRAKIINIVQETVLSITERSSKPGKVGVIASTGAIQLELFQKELQKQKIEPVVMNDEDQRIYFTEPIYEPWGIKAGNTTGRPKERLETAVKILKNNGAEIIIAGCSELPLVLKDTDLDIEIIDAIDAGLKRAINLCLDT